MTISPPSNLRDLSADQIRALLRSRQPDNRTRTAPSLPSCDPQAAHPLSYAQEQLWLQCQLSPDDAVWNIPCRLDLAGPVDGKRLGEAIARVQARHSSLHTAFIQTVEGPRQVARTDVTVPFTEIDANSHETSAILSQAERCPFDPAQPPLFRATLVRTAPDRALLGLVFHHLIIDDHAIGLFVAELARAYGGYDSAQPPAPDACAFALWQRNQNDTPAFSEARRHWIAALAGAETPLDVTDRPRPPRPDHSAASVECGLDADLTGAILAEAARLEVSPFAFLLTAHAEVLSRFHHTSDLVLGTPFANRQLPQTEEMVGFFVNTLPLRYTRHRSEPWCDSVRRMMGELGRALTHGTFPFAHVVEAVSPPRNRDRHLLFQHVIAMQATPITPITFANTSPPLTAMPVLVGPSRSLLDTRLYVWRRNDRFSLLLNHSTALYDAETADGMLYALKTLLQAAVNEPDRPTGNLPTLSVDAKRRLYPVISTEPAIGRAGPGLVARFRDHAATRPDMIAVADDDASLSFAHLDDLSDRLASGLMGAPTPVGLHMRRGCDYATAMLACLKTGVPFVPLDPAYPSARLAAMADTAMIERVLTGAKGSPANWQGPGQARTLEECLAAPTRLGQTANPAATAYILFTSGSTGKPKGVKVSRGALDSYLSAFAARHPIGPDDRILQRAPMSFDASLWEYGMAFAKGAALRVVGDDDARDPRRLAEVMAAWDVTQLRVVPQLLRLLLDDRNGGGLTALPKLKRIICGADVLDVGTASRVRELLPRCELVNAYGPTETTVNCVTGMVDSLTGHPAIGLPLANACALVVDDLLQPVPRGFAGELLIGGACLADGYQGDGERTAHAFVSLPEGDHYRTGDLVRQDRDGRLHFLGRRDAQVKIRGHRIETAEVEIALRNLPGITDAAVSAHDGSLSAWIVAVSDEAADTARLRQDLGQVLPEYMVPDRWFRMTVIPRHASGKLDRRSLRPADAMPVANGGTMPVRPPTATESLILAELKAVLPEVAGTPERSFFELGATSISLATLRLRLEDKLDRPLRLATLFEFSSPRRLAAHLDGASLPETAASNHHSRADHGRRRRGRLAAIRSATA